MHSINKSYVIFAVVAALLLWFFASVSSILTPFVVALIISYFLAPIVGFLQNHRIARPLGTVLVMMGFFVVIALIFLTVFPVLYKQIVILITRAVSHKAEINEVMPRLLGELDTINPELKAKFKESLIGFSSEFMSFFTAMLSRLINSGFAAVNVISLIFITPIVLFYTLRDWNQIICALECSVPRRYAGTAQKLFHDIDHSLSGFIRGQTMVCLILGFYYAISLTFVGIESGIALGVISGILTFIPYVGALFSGFLCILVATIQFGTVHHALLVIGVFVVGQFIEGHFLVPRLVGHNVNLHPVWIMFGIMAGGALLGFVGVLIALPLTAVLGVIIRFALVYYYNSSFYKNKK